MQEPLRELVQMGSTPIKYFQTVCDQFGVIAAPPHWHDAVEILHIRQGRAMQQLDSHVFPVKRSDIVIIWTNQIHATYSAKNEECKIDVYQLPADNHPAVRAIRFAAPITPTHPLYRTIEQTIYSMAQEMQHQKPAYGCAVKSQMYALYTLLVRQADTLPLQTRLPVGHKDTVTMLLELVGSQYQQPLTLTDAARAVHLSIPQVTRVFKQATGMTFKQYVNLFRIDQSVPSLLRGTSVTQTAMECGFENVNTFIRLFKQHKKMTPLQYARVARKAHQAPR